jgi:hypothetical protein
MRPRFPIVVLALLSGAAGAGERTPAPLTSTPGLREQMLAELGPQTVLFVERPLARTFADTHWYANHPAPRPPKISFRVTTRLCRLDLAIGKQQVVLESPDGWIRDPAVHYDGRTILFSYAPAEAKHPGEYGLFRIQADGSGLKRLTGDDGPHSDIEPCWLPDDRILFCSSRVKRIVPCGGMSVPILHRANADGSDVRCLSANVETENTPAVLPDGRVLFMRWEYVDRGETAYHHLWSMNPDGTAVAAYFGNQFVGGVYLDAQPVPGTGEVVYVDAPGHGTTGDHYGTIRLLAASPDPDDWSAQRRLGEKGKHPKEQPWGCDPVPLAKDWFLFAQDDGLWLMHRDGRTECVHRLDANAQDRIQPLPGKPFGKQRARMGLHEPRLLRPRPREPVVRDRVDWSTTTGRLFLADAALGRNMTGVRPGEIRSVLVLEIPPKPGGAGSEHTVALDGYTTGRTMRFLKRVVGEFPVEADGSAYVEVPARRALQLIALDAQGRSVKRMNSFLSVMPGETLSCFGCHERRTETRGCGNPTASHRPPSKLAPIPGVPEFIDYPRDIQPVLDRHCVECHSAERMLGKLDLSGEHGGFRSFSYLSLTQEKYMPWIWFPFGRKTNLSDLPPRSYGSGAWAALPYFDGRANDHEKIRLDPKELRLVQVWADLPAQFRSSYWLGSPQSGTTMNNRWRGTAIESRCAACHLKPKAPGREEHLDFPNFLSPYLDRWALTRLANLCRPEKSVAVRAPLTKEVGGLGWCKDNSGKSVFADRTDPGYHEVLSLVAKEAKPFLDQPDRGRYGKPSVPWGVLKGYGVPFTVVKDIDVLRLQDQYLQAAYPEGREP